MYSYNNPSVRLAVSMIRIGVRVYNSSVVPETQPRPMVQYALSPLALYLLRINIEKEEKRCY